MQKKIKLRYIKEDSAILEQQTDSETTNRISITRHELNCILDFFRNPTVGDYLIYGSSGHPLMVSFCSEDESYVVERGSTRLFGHRRRPGDSEDSAPTPSPQSERTASPLIRLVGQFAPFLTAKNKN